MPSPARGTTSCPGGAPSKIRQMLGGPVRFVLAESGHIAGIINHPAKKKRGYWMNDARNAQAWIPTSGWPGPPSTRAVGGWTGCPGSRNISGKMVEPPPMGSDEYPPIMDAPGTYVLEGNRTKTGVR